MADAIRMRMKNTTTSVLSADTNGEETNQMKDFEKELNRVFINKADVPIDTNRYLSKNQVETDNYNEIMMMYSCAIKEISTKVEVLNEELGLKRADSPIAFIKSRLKSPESIASKLERYGYEVNLESAMEHLHDIAGIKNHMLFH